MAVESIDIKTFTATEALEAYRRVKLTSASGTHVEYADAGAEFIGITRLKVAIGESVPVRLRSAGYTSKAVAAEAFDAGAALYGGLDGTVQDTASGATQGVALEAAVAAGDIVEVYFDNGAGASGIAGSQLGIGNLETEGCVPIVFNKKVTTDSSTTKAIIATVTRKVRVLRWHVVSRDTTAANISLYNGNTNAMTAVVAKGTADDTIVAGGTLIDTYEIVEAAGTIRALASADCDFDVTVVAVPVA